MSSTPLPLLDQLPVGELAPLLQRRTQVGAWLRGVRRRIPLRLRWGNHTARVLIGPDLGSLLRRCSWIVVRLRGEPALLQAEELIRCRAIQVVTGTPYLPGPERLVEILPGAQLERGGFSVPTSHYAPEEVLAVCLVHRIPVTNSRIEYPV